MAGRKYRFYIAYERSGASDDGISRILLHLIGLGSNGLTHRMAIEDEACLYYASLIGQRRPTAEGLKQLLEDYFGVAVRVEQFTGTWNPLPPTNQTFLRDRGVFCEQSGNGNDRGR